MKLFKGIFKHSSVYRQYFVLVCLCVFGISISSIVGSILLMLRFGTNSVSILQEILMHITDYPKWLKIFHFLQIIGLFFFPPVICSYLFSDDNKQYLRMDTFFSAKLLGLVSISIIVLIPIVNSIHALNKEMIFPKFMKGLEEWTKSQEVDREKITERMLQISSLQDLIFNILLLCFFTAIGEECMFRGVLQNIIGKIIQNPHKIIWISAIIFSIIHFQFYGFLPRLFLGAYFGYLLYYTNNLWIPITAHGVYNLYGVLCVFFSQNYPIVASYQIDRIGTGSLWWFSIISFLLFPIIWNKIKNSTSSSFD